MRVQRRPQPGWIVLAGVVVLIARKPVALLRPTIWGEDGTVFWLGALTPGNDLLSAYAGQLWTGQRLLMALLNQLPATAMPIAVYVFSCVAAGLALSVVLLRRAEPVFGSYHRQILAFAVLVLLPGVTEIQGNLANLHVWWAIGVMVLLVLAAPTSPLSKAAELIVVAVVATTGFVGVLLSPVALWSLLRSQDRFVRSRSLVLLAGAVVNIAVWAGQERRVAGDVTERLLTLPGAVAKRWGGGMVYGHHLERVFWPDGFLSVLLVPAVAMVVLLAYLAWMDRRGPSPVWLLSGLAWISLAVVSPTGASDPDWVARATAEWRYFGLAIAAGMLVLVRGMSAQRTRKAATVGLIGCSLALVAGAYLRAPTAGVDQAQLRTFQQCLDGELPRPCTLAIAPQGWVIEVP